MLLENW